MNLFNTIFETVNTNKNNASLFTFSNYFSNTSFMSKYSNLTWKKQIKYKFFIFENFYFNSKIDDFNKEIIIDLFHKTQKRYMALYKFKNLFIYKFKKYKGQQIDLNFNELIENNKYNLVLIQNNNKILFNIFDLIKIICNSLSFECNFFAEPKLIKNPWNNSSFTLSNLYNIYFFIKYSSIEMPILFLRFFQSSFCLKKFKDENQLIIKQYIINNYKNFDTNKKINYITKMLSFYNNLVINNDNINIDPLFPKEKLLPIFEKYIKMFLLSKFSYESDIRIKNKGLLKKKLKLFKKNQPLFGRRIVSLSIKKLYCISELKYKYNNFFFTSLYIPTKDMISLNHKSFFIDYNPTVDDNYSLFPLFESDVTTYYSPPSIKGLSEFIKSVVFSEQQKHIIQTEFKPILDNIQFGNNNNNCLCSDNSSSAILQMSLSQYFDLLSNLNDLSGNPQHTINQFETMDQEEEEEELIHNFSNLQIDDESSSDDNLSDGTYIDDSESETGSIS